MNTIDCRSEDGVLRIVLSSPPVNILSIAMMDEVAAALGDAGDARLVVFTGAGKHFSAGADVGEHLPETGRRMMDSFDAMLEAVRGLEVPSLAAVHGACLGAGFELALACDLVVVSETARLGVPEIRLGVFPPAAAAWLPERIGPIRAADLVLTGREIDGLTAGKWGLASRVLPAEGFADGVAELVGHLGGLSGEALRAARAALGVGSDLAAVSRLYRERTLTSADAIEGLTSFLEKRSPVWSHARG